MIRGAFWIRIRSACRRMRCVNSPRLIQQILKGFEYIPYPTAWVDSMTIAVPKREAESPT